MNTQIHLKGIIPASMAGIRLDQALSQLFPDYSRARFQTWIKANHVTLNGVHKRPRDTVLGGEEVEILTNLEVPHLYEAENLSLSVIYEDDDILVLDKPAGLVVHPGAGNHEGTLLNALLHHAPNLQYLPRAGIVHRLDKDTSGLMVVAKSLPAHTALIDAMQQRLIQREYEAIVTGNVPFGGHVDQPLGRHPKLRTRMAVVSNGKPSITHYRILEKFRGNTYLRLKLETGRTHQIRVHMAHLGYPIAGDPVYGRFKLTKGASANLTEKLKTFSRQALHAVRLALHHPITQVEFEWVSPLPQDMNDLLTSLRQENEET